MIIRRKHVGFGLSALGMAVSAQLSAQTAGLDEVVVTAQKRVESAQDTPISIDVVSADALIREGIKDMIDITKTSTVLETNTRNGGQNVTIGMRGMQQLSSSPTSDGLVAVHLDGVYLASMSGLSGMMYDLERVEVVAGPQGTLYGRNATAGAINVITRRPRNEFGGNASVEFGDYDSFRVQGGVDLPVSDSVAIRLAGQRNKREELYTAGGGSQNQWGGRASLLWKAGDQDELFMSVDYNEYRSTEGSPVLLGLYEPATVTTAGVSQPTLSNPGGIYSVPSNPYDNLDYQQDRAFQTVAASPAGFLLSAPLTTEQRRNGLLYMGGRTFQHQWGANVQYTHSLEDFDVSLLYGHRGLNGRASGVEKAITSWSENLTPNTVSSDSAELRFISTGNGAFEWVGGLYAFRSYSRAFNAVPIGPYGGRANLPSLVAFGPVVQGAAGGPLMPIGLPAESCPCQGGTFDPNSGTARSYAIYGQTTWTPAGLDQWHFTLGLRYSYDKKTGDLGTPTGKPTVDEDGAGPLPPGYYYRFPDLKGNWDGVQYKVGVEYEFNDSSRVYGSVSTGYKSGGFVFGPTGGIEPENVLAYEIGTKNRFLDNTLQFNVAAWLYNYTDLESNYNLPFSPPFPLNATGQPIFSVGTVTNVREARMAGSTIDADWLFTPADQFGFSFTYVYSKILDGRSKKTGEQILNNGARLQDSPKFAAIGRYGHTFTLPGGATIVPQAKYQWQSEKYNASTIQKTIISAGVVYERPFDPRYTTIPSQGLLDLSVKYAPASDAWDVTAYVNNATDELDIKSLNFNDNRNTAANSTTGHQTATLGDPRIWGLIFNVRF
jgi:iron complex outermembrane receptor protein